MGQESANKQKPLETISAFQKMKSDLEKEKQDYEYKKMQMKQIEYKISREADKQFADMMFKTKGMVKDETGNWVRIPEEYQGIKTEYKDPKEAFNYAINTLHIKDPKLNTNKDGTYSIIGQVSTEEPVAVDVKQTPSKLETGVREEPAGEKDELAIYDTIRNNFMANKKEDTITIPTSAGDLKIDTTKGQNYIKEELQKSGLNEGLSKKIAVMWNEEGKFIGGRSGQEYKNIAVKEFKTKASTIASKLDSYFKGDPNTKMDGKLKEMKGYSNEKIDFAQKDFIQRYADKLVKEADIEGADYEKLRDGLEDYIRKMFDTIRPKKKR